MLEFNTTFLVCMASFVIFLLMINAILYEPLAHVVHQRKRYIETNYKDANEIKENTEKIINWRKERLQKSKEVAKEVYTKVITEFKLKKDTLIEYEHNIAAKDLSGVRVKLENIDREAKIRLKEHVGDLASAIASKFLGYETRLENINEETVDSILNTSKEHVNG